jgi:membrane protein involved in colicin uptake
MARGLMTALQAALAGVSGGATGYAQYQRQQKEEQARQQELERQRLRDVLAQRQFDAQYSPEALARQERLTKEEREARAAEARAQREFEAKQGELQRDASLRAAGISAGAAAARDRAEREAEKAQTEQLAEAWWNQTVVRRGEEGAVSPARMAAAQRAAETFNRLRAAPGGRSKTPQELMAAAYAAEMARQNTAIRRGQANLDEEEAPPIPTGFLGGQAGGAGEVPKLPANRLPPGVSIEQYNTDAGYRRFINQRIAGGR